MLNTSKYYTFLIAVGILFLVSIFLFSRRPREDNNENHDSSATASTLEQRQYVSLIHQLKNEIQILREQTQALHKECDNNQQFNFVSSPINTDKPVIASSNDNNFNTNELEELMPHYRLIIGIPTIERPAKTSYLDQTLESYVQQLGSFSSFADKILVLVMNMNDAKGLPHDSFDHARIKYGKYPFFKFVSNGPYARKPRDPSTFFGTERQRQTVMQQSMDLVALLDAAVRIKSDFFMFMEDDMTVCSNALKAVLHMVDKASLYHGNFMCIRCGFGMNGIILQNKNTTGHDKSVKNDVKRYADYMFNRYERRPPDHLIVEFCAAETEESKAYVQKRVNVGYRYNLFHHLGDVSTIRSEKHWGFPGCHTELLVPTVFEVEGFNPKQCPNDDIWPCNVPEEKQKIYPWIKWKNP